MTIAQKQSDNGWRVNLYDDYGQLVGRVYRSSPIVIRNETDFLRLVRLMTDEGVCYL